MKKIIIYLIILLIPFSGAIAKSELIAIPQIVEFGQVYKDSPKIVKRVKIVNRSMKHSSIRSFRIDNNQLNLFSMITPIPFVIPFQTGKALEIELNPQTKFIGKIRAELLLFEPGFEDTLIVPLVVEILKPDDEIIVSRLMIPQLSAKVGETVLVPVIVKGFEDSTEILDRFSLILSFNASVMAPLDDYNEDFIESGIRNIKIDSTILRKLKSGDTLISIPFIIGLGDAVSSPLNISEFKWLSKGKNVRVYNYIENGTLNISDIFFSNGIPRLITSKINELFIYPLANPVTNDFQLKIRYMGSPTLSLFSLTGEILADYTGEIPISNDLTELSINVSRSLFANKGIYIVRLSDNGYFVSQMLLVE